MPEIAGATDSFIGHRLLAEAQRRIGAALLSATHADAAAHLLQGAHERNVRRLAIYRANSIANASRALRAHYPVIEQVVGEEFMGGLARAYRDAYPSHDGDLGQFGDDFAIFLEGFAPVRDLPYLPDLARLEWAVHRALTAADEPAVPIARAPALLWMPGTHVLAAQFPAADIWRAHQPASGLSIEQIAPGPQGALVFREGLLVRVETLAFEQALALIDLISEEQA